MNYVFLCEFEELRSPLRDASSQGGGVHGNGILSRFNMSDARVIQHRCGSQPQTYFCIVNSSQP
jgi:hypothetical protein